MMPAWNVDGARRSLLATTTQQGKSLVMIGFKLTHFNYCAPWRLLSPLIYPQARWVYSARQLADWLTFIF
jgi:hypothetical protein